MHTHTTFEVNINGSDTAIKEIAAAIREVITDEEFDVCSEIEIEETYKCPDIEAVTDLAKKMAKCAHGAHFELNGVIDASESAGELMDFSIIYDGSKLIRKSTDWYVETCIEEYESYEEFMDEWEDEAGELEVEQFESLKDENEFVFFVETKDGTVLMSEVPMKYEAEIGI